LAKPSLILSKKPINKLLCNILIVGAIIDRPQILPKQNLSPQSEHNFFPSGNPKIFDFRRAISDRPYIANLYYSVIPRYSSI